MCLRRPDLVVYGASLERCSRGEQGSSSICIVVYSLRPGVVVLLNREQKEHGVSILTVHTTRFGFRGQRVRAPGLSPNRFNFVSR